MIEKAALIMDMPKKCHECPFAYITLSERNCLAMDVTIDVDIKKEKPKWCPLKKLPDYYEDDSYSYTKGWNDCLDEIVSE